MSIRFLRMLVSLYCAARANHSFSMYAAGANGTCVLITIIFASTLPETPGRPKLLHDQLALAGRPRAFVSLMWRRLCTSSDVLTRLQPLQLLSAVEVHALTLRVY